MMKEILKYQETDAKLYKIERDLAGNPARKKALTAKKFLDGVAEATASLEAKAQECTQKYKMLAEAQNSLIKAVSEYDDVEETGEDEISYVQKKAKEVEGSILAMAQELKNLEDAISEIVASYEDLKKKTQQAQAMYKENAPLYNQARAEVKEEREALAAELEALKKAVPEKVMQMYLERRNDKVPFPIVCEFPENSKNCPACGMEFSLQELGEIKKEKVGACKNCHKILYL